MLKTKGKVVEREGGINLNIYVIWQYKLELNQKYIISPRINSSNMEVNTKKRKIYHTFKIEL